MSVLLIAYRALLGEDAMAFDASEHCALSNLALDIAFEFVKEEKAEQPHLLTENSAAGQNARARFHEVSDEQLTIVKDTDKTATSEQLAASNVYCFPHKWSHRAQASPFSSFSYGMITALVDYTINPADLFVSDGTRTEPPTSQEQLNPDFFFPPAGLASKLDVSSHNNADHFQGDVLLLFDHWHTNALNEAVKSDGARLFRALANEAVADHFLEDSFAPGHLLTPRRGMSDAMSLSWHDAFNARGRVMGVRNWSELTRLYEFLLGTKDRYNCAFQRIGDKPVNSMKACAERTSFQDALKNLPASLLTECRPHRSRFGRIADVLADPRAHKFAAVLRYNGKLLESLPHDQGVDPATAISICTQGDGSLDEHERTADQAAKLYIPVQKAFMVLVEARYIADILESYIITQRLSDDYGYTWCPMMHSVANAVGVNGGPGNTLHDCVKLLEQAQAVCRDTTSDEKTQCTTLHLVPTAVAHYFAYVSNPAPSDKLSGGTLDPRDFLYSLHGGAISGNQRVFGVVGLEVGFGVIDQDSMTLTSEGFTNDCFYRQIIHSCRFEALIAAGFEYNMGNTSRASYAETLRAAYQVSDLGFQVGPYAKIVRIGNGVTHRDRVGYGARADLGFSLLSFYLAVGAEPRLYEPVRTARGFAISTGVSFSLNGRRLGDSLTGRNY